MKKSSLDSRQITIKHLREFLHKSVNLEPELEQFVKTLILSLEYAEMNNTSSPCSFESFPKFRH